jgi:hypothetical protein
MREGGVIEEIQEGESLDALRLVAEALNTSLDHALRDRGGGRASDLKGESSFDEFLRDNYS